MGLRYSIGVEQQPEAGLELHEGPVPGRAFLYPDRDTGSQELLNNRLFLGPNDLRRIMPGMAVGQMTGIRIQNLIESGHKQIGGGVSEHPRVGGEGFSQWA